MQPSKAEWERLFPTVSAEQAEIDAAIIKRTPWTPEKRRRRLAVERGWLTYELDTE